MLTPSAVGADERLREERQCWICMGNDPNDLGGLIAPCSCRGSMKWVHRDCLDTWRVSARNPENFTSCRNCAFRFQMVARSSSVEELQQDIERMQRQKRFKRDALVRILSAFLLSQVMLFVLAAGMLAGDAASEGIVVLFHLQERAPVGEASFAYSLEHHKASYYLGALSLSLLLFGLVLSVQTCIGCYQGRGTARVGEIRGGIREGCCMCCRTPLDRALCAQNSRGCLLCCSGCDCAACVGNAGEACSLLGADCTCCSDLNGLFAGCTGDAAPVMIFCCGVLLVAMVAFGAFYLLFMIFAWCVTEYKKYMQLRELRDLVGEYIVKDLSEDVELQAEPSVGPRSFFVSGAGEDLEHGNDVERRMMRDLQHAYRLDEGTLAERLARGGENVAARSPREAVEPDRDQTDANSTQPAQAPRQQDIEGN